MSGPASVKAESSVVRAHGANGGRGQAEPPLRLLTRGGRGPAGLRVAQSALLREVPASVTAGRLASRYVSAAAEARVGGDAGGDIPARVA